MKIREQIYKKSYFRTTTEKSLVKLLKRMTNVFPRMRNMPTTIQTQFSTISYTKKLKSFKLISIKFRPERRTFNLSMTRLAVGLLESEKNQLTNQMITLQLTKMHHYFNSSKTFRFWSNSNLTLSLTTKNNVKRLEVGKLQITKTMTSL